MSTEGEAYLEGLEQLGARFGLNRIEALTTALGRPQDRFAVVHIVGTNGKSSVARAVEALLNDHGVPAGSYLSPHLESWRERIRVNGQVVSAGQLDAAVAAVASAVERLALEEPVTQFEASTAAAFVALAEAGVEAAAIEAGLGGRLDATNVVESAVTVLTSVGLEHTEWLGPDEIAIATEKLAVLREGSVLVLGDVSPEVERLARETAANRRARVIVPPRLRPELVAGAYRRRNLALAIAASQVLLAALGRELNLDPDRLVALARSLEAPGRLEVLTEVGAVLDVAHNPDGAAALVESLPELVGTESLVACVALLVDKDAERYAAELAPCLAEVVCTAIDPAQLRHGGRPGAAPMPADEVAAAFTAAGVPSRVEPDPAQALMRTRALAAAGGRMSLVTGSHHLVSTARRSWLCDD